MLPTHPVPLQSCSLASVSEQLDMVVVGLVLVQRQQKPGHLQAEQSKLIEGAITLNVSHDRYSRDKLTGLLAGKHTLIGICYYLPLRKHW